MATEQQICVGCRRRINPAFDMVRADRRGRWHATCFVSAHSAGRDVWLWVVCWPWALARLVGRSRGWSTSAANAAGAAFTVLVVVLALGLAASASAWQAPGQQAADPAVSELAGRALAFWREHGQMNCPLGVKVWQAPHLVDVDGDAWGRGDGATCELWVSDALADVIVEPAVPRGGATDACTCVTHEVGHALGLPHAVRGVMAGGTTKPPRPQAWAPRFCRRWARFTIRAVLRGDGYSERQIRELRVTG